MELKNNEIGLLEKDLPGFCLLLCLLLNSGLVLHSAVEKINCFNINGSLLYSFISFIDKDAKVKNIPFENNLYLAARKIKSRNLIKLSLLLMNSSSTGTELASKLEQECSILQNGRLQSAKAKAKEADTKLCFPLMLLLISILLICMVPAFMQM